MKACRLCLGFCLLDACPSLWGRPHHKEPMGEGSRNGEDLMKASSNIPVSVLRSRSSRPNGDLDNCPNGHSISTAA